MKLANIPKSHKINHNWLIPVLINKSICYYKLHLYTDNLIFCLILIKVKLKLNIGTFSMI